MNDNGKRSLDAESSESEPESDYDSPVNFKWDCNQIRTKINRLIRSGEMKVTEFQRSQGINSNSYGRFMKLKGPHSGSDNQTYEAATRYFLKREAQGIKMPQAKKAKAEDLAKFDVSDIHLTDEETEELPIYDTCDDLRKKIEAHLRNPGITQAGFCRTIGKAYNPQRNFQSKQLSDFLKKKGPTAGCESGIYYASYVYFEKLRIKRGEKKSKKRLQVEDNVPEGMTRRRQGAVFCHVSSTPYEDEFGRIRKY